MDYRRWIGGSGIMTGFVVVVINYTQGDVVFATILLVLLCSLLALLLWLTSPSHGGSHISHAAAQASAGDSDVIVYWRPGSIHCDRLKFGLGSVRDDVSWVNILKDSEAAEVVATYRDGNRAVPTAVTGRAR